MGAGLAPNECRWVAAHCEAIKTINGTAKSTAISCAYGEATSRRRVEETDG
jgi:hypothetical protein